MIHMMTPSNGWQRDPTTEKHVKGVRLGDLPNSFQAAYEESLDHDKIGGVSSKPPPLALELQGIVSCFNDVDSHRRCPLR